MVKYEIKCTVILNDCDVEKPKDEEKNQIIFVMAFEDLPVEEVLSEAVQMIKEEWQYYFVKFKEITIKERK